MESQNTIRIAWLLGIVAAEYILVLLAVLADMVSGIRKARARGDATRSRALRRTVDKLARYYNVLIVLSVVDAMIIVAGFFARVVEGYDVPTLPLFTLIGSVAIAAIEVKSVFEKSSVKEKEDINNLISFLQHAANNDSLKSIINHLKSMKK